jgi:hypothetical protein
MFSYCKMNFNLRILDMQNKIVSGINVERIIRYDRWNNYYLIKDSFNPNERKLLNFEDIAKNINVFNKIPVKFKNASQIKGRMKLEFDYYLKSVDFVEPFKFIEYTMGLGNIRYMNNRYEFNIEKQ